MHYGLHLFLKIHINTRLNIFQNSTLTMTDIINIKNKACINNTHDRFVYSKE